MSELSFSCHISAKNHAIKNKTSLAQLIKHFLNLYKDKAKRGNKEVTPLYNYTGNGSVMDSLKAVYRDEFSEALEEYNRGQIANGHPERCIDDYFEHVNDSNRDLVTEMIIQIGDVRFWDSYKPEEHKEWAEKIYPDLLKELQDCMPDFKIVSAVIHTREETKDENGNVLYNGSPHIDILGVPVASGYKNGMKKQCAKTRVFTKSSLRKLQDRLHKKADEIVKREFGEDYSIAAKQDGRNASLSPSAYKWFMEHEKSLRQLIDQYENEKNDKADFYEDIVNLFPDLEDVTPDNMYNMIKDLQNNNDFEQFRKDVMKRLDLDPNEVEGDDDILQAIDDIQEALEESEQFGNDIMTRLGLNPEEVEDPDKVIQALDDLISQYEAEKESSNIFESQLQRTQQAYEEMKDNYEDLKRRSGVPSVPQVSDEDFKKEIQSSFRMADGLAIEPEISDEDDFLK